MPVIQGEVVVAANGVVENVLTGSQFEYLPYNAALNFGFQASAAGGSQLRIDCLSGQDILAEQMAVGSAARPPIFPDDFPLDDVAAGGERIKIRVRNISGAAVTLFYSVKITPI